MAKSKRKVEMTFTRRERDQQAAEAKLLEILRPLPKAKQIIVLKAAAILLGVNPNG